MEITDIKETKILQDEINEKLNNDNKKYYKDILDFLNTIFISEEKSILKIKLNSITINQNVFEIYNYIINKYKLNKDLINIDYFDFDISYDRDDIIKIIMLISNNLLEKLNYKMISYVNKYTNKKMLKIKIKEN
jgi:hypothetical protein